MSTVPKHANEIISDILREIAPLRVALLKKIIEIEEVHLADKSSVTPQLIAAEIEKAAKADEASAL